MYTYIIYKPITSAISRGIRRPPKQRSPTHTHKHHRTTHKTPVTTRVSRSRVSENETSTCQQRAPSCLITTTESLALSSLSGMLQLSVPFPADSRSQRATDTCGFPLEVVCSKSLAASRCSACAGTIVIGVFRFTCKSVSRGVHDELT